jgi:hypothetical protein
MTKERSWRQNGKASRVVLDNQATIIREDEAREILRSAGVEDSKALSDNPVNKIMDTLGPAIVLFGILSGALFGLGEAAGSGIMESIIGPGFGLHGTGALVYIMSMFAFACIGGILGMFIALIVNAVLSIGRALHGSLA